MAETFLLEIVTPYRRLFSKEVEEMSAPGALGEFGVLAGHTPLVTILTAGVLAYKKGAESGRIAIGKGYAEVTHTRTTILVDNAEADTEIDIQTARDALQKAEDMMRGLDPDAPDYKAAQEAFELAEARIAVKEKQGK
ncbi:MAG: F0F1 ATP synthase subunit epsilon [Deltaproteobacteria bacterium]|nr:F0F1 ATP synthase subunit epsilon [Deltaproteobacteria bacterium]